MFAKIKLVVPYQLTLPTIGPLIGGEPNPFYPLILFMNDSVAKRDRFTHDGITYTYNAEVILSMFTQDLIGLVVQQGGEIHSLPLFFQVDLDGPVHARLQVEEESVPTWGEWFSSQPNREPIHKEDGYYIGTNVFGQDYLPASEALALGVTLLLLPEIQAKANYAPVVEPDPEGDEPTP
jgi:hypothetical protein